MDDNIGLLEYGETFISKPDLRAFDNPREVAMGTLSQVNTALADHVKHFLRVATFFANPDPIGSARKDKLHQRYSRQHFNLEQAIAKKLNKN